MFRLVFLTLGGLGAVLLLYGTPEMAGARGEAAAPALAASVHAPGVVPATVRGAEPTLAPLDHAELTRIAIAAATRNDQIGGVATSAPSTERAAAAPESPATLPVLYVTGSAVNLRAAPDGDVLGSLRRGAAVTGIGPTSGAWVEIEAQDGQRGFMSASYLSPRKPG